MQRIRQATSEGHLSLCSFSMTEIAHKVARKRLTLGEPTLSWFRASLRRPGPRLLDITPEIAALTAQLPETFQGDPGDRILAATAIVEDLTICTHDDLLLRFGKQGLFRVMKVSQKKEKHGR
jgi:PIN domain nuclease of toxin-antitoxin system